MEKIKKDISEFYDLCFKSQNEFVKKMSNILTKLDDLDFKTKVASKYNVVIGGDDAIFVDNQKSTLIAESELLVGDFLNRIRFLNKIYKNMMKKHLSWDKEWEKKKDKLEAWYTMLLKQVWKEKEDFRKEVENNCEEIKNMANDILHRIGLFSLAEEGFKETKDVIIWMSTAGANAWMRSIMDIDLE